MFNFNVWYFVFVFRLNRILSKIRPAPQVWIHVSQSTYCHINFCYYYLIKCLAVIWKHRKSHQFNWRTEDGYKNKWSTTQSFLYSRTFVVCVFSDLFNKARASFYEYPENENAYYNPIRQSIRVECCWRTD